MNCTWNIKNFCYTDLIYWFQVVGSGKSKKEAKHDAASTYLSRMKYFNALTENGTTQPQDTLEM